MAQGDTLTRSLIYQARQADHVGLMTSKFFTALDEQEIFNIMDQGTACNRHSGRTVDTIRQREMIAWPGVYYKQPAVPLVHPPGGRISLC